MFFQKTEKLSKNMNLNKIKSLSQKETKQMIVNNKKLNKKKSNNYETKNMFFLNQETIIDEK